MNILEKLFKWPAYLAFEPVNVLALDGLSWNHGIRQRVYYATRKFWLFRKRAGWKWGRPPEHKNTEGVSEAMRNLEVKENRIVDSLFD